MTEVTRLVLVPEGQETCLIINTYEGTPLGTLKLYIDNIELKCHAKNAYFTRDFNMKVEAIKRCPKAGSCTGSKCHQYTSTSKIKEISDMANSRPGFTGCASVPGCAPTCFFCTDACLFFRTYAEPITETIYEVFECPLWSFQVRAVVIMELNTGETFKQEVMLEPGIQSEWRNFKMTLVGVTDPPSPILSKMFLTDGTRVLSLQHQPVSNLLQAQ